MDVEELRRTYVYFKASMFNEEILDENFNKLQQIQSDSEPDLVFDILATFFRETEKFLNELDTVLVPPNVDFKKADFFAHKMKGSCSSVGAGRLTKACISFREFGKECKIKECLRCLHEIKEEYVLLKNKLEHLLWLEKRILEVSGSIPK